MNIVSEHHIFIFIIQIFLVLLLARSLGEILKKIGQSPLFGELIIGVLLGPTIMGRFFPNIHKMIFPLDPVQIGMFEAVAWLGVLFLLLETGLEIDFTVAWRHKNNALIVAVLDIIIPMLVAFFPTLFLSNKYLIDAEGKLIFSLFIATVMTISAMPVASKIMHDLKLLKTEIGFITMSALAVNDIIGWALFTIILSIFSRKTVIVFEILFIILFVIIFSGVALTIGRKFSSKIISFFERYKFSEPSSSFTFACLLGLIFGAITQIIGIHALFGFFIAGIIVGSAKNLKEETRSIISQMVHALFVPLFFVNIGLKHDFIKNFDLFLVIFMCVIGIIGRYIGAYAGSIFANIPKINRNIIAIAHVPGGMMEIVVALLAYEEGLITEKVFVAIIASAIFSSIVVAPWMKIALIKRKKISIITFIPDDNAIFFLESKNKLDAINELFNVASRYIKIPEKELKKAKEDLLVREEDYSTAIGDQIAIPHVRLENIKEPVLFFAFSREGIDWNSPDGKDVHLIFLLFSPALYNDIHLEILTKIAFSLQKMENRRILLNSTTQDFLIKNVKVIFQRS